MSKTGILGFGATILAVLLFVFFYPLWQFQHVRVDCELRLCPGMNELTVCLPDKLHSLLLATRGEQNTLSVGCIVVSGSVHDKDGVQVKKIDYRGPDFVQSVECFGNLGRIGAEGRCRITIDYANTNNLSVPIYLVVTKVK